MKPETGRVFAGESGRGGCRAKAPKAREAASLDGGDALRPGAQRRARDTPKAPPGRAARRFDRRYWPSRTAALQRRHSRTLRDISDRYLSPVALFRFGLWREGGLRISTLEF